MKKTADIQNNDRVPKFASLEDEKKYWNERSPLAEGRRGRLNRPRTEKKLSSFLAVRLSGEELTQLRDLAAKQGMGPSTYARTLLVTALQQQSAGHSLEAFTAELRQSLTSAEVAKLVSILEKINV